MQLRTYQRNAVDSVLDSSERRQCLVAPTGSGKTVMGAAIAAQHDSVLWVAHRRELVLQAATALKRIGCDVGLVLPGEPGRPGASIQVGTVQTLLARRETHHSDLVVLDECHHYAADEWVAIADSSPGSKSLGLTATPQRGDGRPLGDIFDRLVVAAQYSELLEQGHLVPCRVLQPPEYLGVDYALNPHDAWMRHGERRRTLAFYPSVKAAKKAASEFRDSGVPAECIHATTPTDDRDEILASLAAGDITVVTNVHTMTEGVDVPSVSCVLLARGCEHTGMYLQIAGRALRPSPGKDHALFIDLTGATLKHGLPTEDRVYSLDGDGVKRTSAEPLRQCPECGRVAAAWASRCPHCGWRPPPQPERRARIYSLELREVYAGAETAEQHKRRELERLMAEGRKRGWTLYFIQKEYKKLFGEMPALTMATVEERRAEYSRLVMLQQSKGWKPGYSRFRYKQTFGDWPSREVM